MKSQLGSFLLVFLALAPLEARQWTSADGRTLEAELVSFQAGQVTLRRDSDGQTFTLPLSRFSAADQEWVKAQKPAVTSAKSGDHWFACDFEKADWQSGWNLGNPNLPRNLAVTAKSSFPEISFPTGNALEVTLKQGTHYGADFGFDLAGPAGVEPEEAVLSYKLCFSPDFNAEAVQGGKLPGFGGMYGDSGSAGRKVNGRDSWSARGAYWKPDARGDIPIGFYVYHADMEKDYGDTWYFSRALERGKWHDIRLHIKLNTPASKPDGQGRNDGLLRAWVDGKEVFEKRDIRFRDTSELKIRNAWFHFYHGGGSPASADYKLWIDEVTISPKP